MKISTFFRILLLSIPFISFGQSSSLTINVTATAAKCNGSTNGSAIANVSGGTGPYTYVWGPTGGTGDTASNLATGTYTVTIKDANGLTVTDTITITQPPALTVSIDSIVVLPCFRMGVHQNPHPFGGGACGCSNTLWAVVNGGTAPYTYYWTPSGTTTDSLYGACYEVFTVLVTDKNGCTVSDSENVVVPANRPTELDVVITTTDAHCSGSNNGSASADVSGGVGPYTYSWAPKKGSADSATNLPPGTYTLTVTDSNGLTDVEIVVIGQVPTLTVSIDTIIVQPCFRNGLPYIVQGGGACGCSNTLWAVVNGGTAPYTYYWTPGGTTTDSLYGACYEVFTVLVTDKYGCTSIDSENVVIPDANTDAGINQYNNTFGLKLYPVPAGNQLTVSIAEASKSIQSMEIFDLFGNKLIEQKINPTDILVTVDVSALMAGNYLLKISGGSTGQKIARFTIAGK
jgi:hypothetical protein